MTSIITQRQREGKGIYDCLLGRSQVGRVKYKYTTCEAREKERGTENLLLDPRLDPPGSTDRCSCIWQRCRRCYCRLSIGVSGCLLLLMAMSTV